MEDGANAPTLQGWNARRSRYACADHTHIQLSPRTAKLRDLNARVERPTNSIIYTKDRKSRRLKPTITPSGAALSRDMKSLFGGSDGIRTVTFPNTVRSVRQGAFFDIPTLRSAILNNGLEALGTSERCRTEARTAASSRRAD